MPIDLALGDTKLILAECRLKKLSIPQTAYVLATARWETGHTMKPVRETKALSDDQAIRRLDTAHDKGRLPWVKTKYWQKDADGKTWLGRGYVQLTWRANYEKAGEKLNVDLLTDPNKALDPDIAKKVLVQGMQHGWFTGKKLSDFISGTTKNYVSARKIINGTDKAQQIADLALAYEKLLTPTKKEAEEQNKPGKTPLKKGGLQPHSFPGHRSDPTWYPPYVDRLA